MTKTPHQTIKTPNGEELVVLPRAAFDRLASLAGEAEADLANLRAYDAAVAELDSGAASPLPVELSALLLEHKSRLAATRRWRGMS